MGGWGWASVCDRETVTKTGEEFKKNKKIKNGNSRRGKSCSLKGGGGCTLA